MKLDRLLGILTILLQNNRVTAPQLAQRFEVTRRTIGRDIDALCMAGIPIVTHQGGGGGIAIAEGFKLDKSILTADELMAMIAALKGIGSVSDQARFENTLSKLSVSGDAVVSLREPILIDLASHYKGSLTAKITSIKQAILENRLIEFDYYYERGEARRRIEPALILFQWTAWYVFGYCLTRKDWRLYKLQRLWNLQIFDETFTPREIPADKQPATCFPDDKTLVALFAPSAKYKLIESYGPNCFTQTPDGLLRLTIRYTNREFVMTWLLGFGDSVKVLEPVDIAEALLQIAKNMIAAYE